MNLFAPRSWSLRTRVGLGFALLSLGVATVLSLSTYRFFVDLEHRMIQQTLDLEFNEFMRRWRVDPTLALPNSKTLKTYVWSLDQATPDLRELLTAEDHTLVRFAWKGRTWFALSHQEDNFLFALILDDAQTRQREQQLALFLAAIGLLLACLGGLVGWWLTLTVIRPVRVLAHQIAHMEPDEQIHLPDLGTNDELEQLRQAFATLNQRVVAFIDREQAFTSDASHELRTPVSIISGAAELLRQEGHLSALGDRALTRIERASDDMNTLIYSLMSLAREKSCHTSPDCEKCNLQELVGRIVETQSSLIRQKAIEVSVEVPPFIVMADCRLLHVIIENLIRNALLYTDQGHIRIHFTACRLMIEDSGCGIKDSDQTRVFKRFAQGRSEGMAGVGLELCKRIADRYGWTLALEHGPNHTGTTASLNLGCGAKAASTMPSSNP